MREHENYLISTKPKGNAIKEKEQYLEKNKRKT